VFDWNQIEQAKKLGSGSIELSELEPFQGTERVVKLSHARHGDKGEVRVRLTFTPEVIYKSRQKTSTFSTAGRAMTQIGGAPVGAGKSVVGSVGKVFRKDHAKSLSSESYTGNPALEAPSGQATISTSQPMSQSHSRNGSYSPPTGTGSGSALFPTASHSTLDSADAPGMLRVTIIDAKDVSDDGDAVKPYVNIRVADKEAKTKHVGKTTAPEWQESFTFVAGAQTPKVYVWVYDHKTLGRDKLLGEGEVDVSTFNPWLHATGTLTDDRIRSGDISSTVGIQPQKCRSSLRTARACFAFDLSSIRRVHQRQSRRELRIQRHRRVDSV
jgi:Ca2+-dependent lipid-binding protein